MSFIAANEVYTRTNKTTIVWIETELFVFLKNVHVRALALGCFYSHISTRTFRRALTASLDSWQSLEEGAGKRCSECESSPHLSMVSARVSSSGAHRHRYTHSLKPSPTFPRYQFTNSHGQPEGGGGKKGEEGSSLLPSPLSTVWNYKHYYFGEVLSRAEGGNRKYWPNYHFPQE